MTNNFPRATPGRAIYDNAKDNPSGIRNSDSDTRPSDSSQGRSPYNPTSNSAQQSHHRAPQEQHLPVSPTSRTTPDKLILFQQHNGPYITTLAAWAKHWATGPSSMLIMRSLELHGLDYLWTATAEPPITEKSLSELDLDRIITDSKLRHDLNFEIDVAFRPNYESSRGQEKMVQAKQYWRALSVELAAYIDYAQQLAFNTSPTSPVLLLNEPCMVDIPWRVPQLLKTIRQILKTLVPSAEWDGVDRTLDVDLVMQQLRNGVYDLNGLSVWLGDLLKRSCSPVRDPDVLKMVQTIQAAVEQNSSRLLAQSVEGLFGVLETMKLDVANHQIRHLRVLMINDSTTFEQQYFKNRIVNGMDIFKAYEWYRIAPREDAPRLNTEMERLETFSLAVIEMVISKDSIALPTTFEFDFERIHALRYDIRDCMGQMICNEAFIKLSFNLGYNGQIPAASTTMLLNRISQLDAWWSQGNSQDQAEKPALEIVREAYRICNIDGMPSEKHLLKVKYFLTNTFERYSPPYEDLEWALCQELEKMVQQELRIISPMTPLEILNHYEPRPALPEIEAPPNSLLNIAIRIAHITILHWRVWSKLLYLQPKEVVEGRTELSKTFGFIRNNHSLAISEDKPRDMLP